MDDYILLIENDPVAAKTIEAVLTDVREAPSTVVWVRTLADGVERLRQGEIGAVIVNLFLPDSKGIPTFDTLFLAAPQVPVLVLTGLREEQVARQAVQRGAQDYILQDHIDSHWLPRALRYLTARKATEEALFTEKERAQVTLNSIGDAVLSTDITGNVNYLNLAAETMTGWSRQEASGRPFADVFHIINGDTRQPMRDPMELAVQKNQVMGLSPNCILIRRDGFEAVIEDSVAPVHDRGGRVVGAVIVFHDVTEARAMVLKMSHLAQHDALTGLPNRVLLNDRLTQTITAAQRHATPTAVLFLDLDRFKNINDSLGHTVGDALLQSVAQRLVSCLRGSDTVSRQGGDEFVILLREIQNIKDVAARAKKILAALVAPHNTADHMLHITASVGISVFPEDGEDAETLIKSADIAMYHAKNNGRNNYQFFKHDMNTRAVERQSIEDDLRGAVGRKEFVLHYQPKINLETGAITGAEALIRWRHPRRGLLLPAHFVPIAEDSGLIVSIGRSTLREACRQARAWLDAGRSTTVAVNISAVEFKDKGFLANVSAALDEARLEPRFLELELTESVLMQNSMSTASVIHALASMGVRFAIDDFGTGYSSFSYLKQFPIDSLKIDQSFVRHVASDPSDGAIVAAMISMCRSLKRRVIAEGVETRAQVAFLQAQRCTEGQGYFFSRPIVAAEFTKLLKTGIFKCHPGLSAELFLRRGDVSDLRAR